MYGVGHADHVAGGGEWFAEYQRVQPDERAGVGISVTDRWIDQGVDDWVDHRLAHPHRAATGGRGVGQPGVRRS